MNLTGTPVHVDEIWRPCDPRARNRVRVTNVSETRVDVVDATTGDRPRSILRQEFHDSPETKHGGSRRTGYLCVQAAPAPSEQERLRAATRLVMNAKRDPDGVDVQRLLAQLDDALNPLPF